jgi:hypothetical protein
MMHKQGYILTQNQGFTVPGLEMPSLNNDPELSPLPRNKNQFFPMELENPAMAAVLEENTTSPTRLKIPRGKVLQAEIKPTNEPRPRGEEYEADSTKAKEVSASTQKKSVADVSQETQHAQKNSKMDDKQKEKSGKADPIKDIAVSASTQAPGVRDASQQTQETQRESKEDGPVEHSTMTKSLFAKTQAPQVPAEAKPRERGEGFGEDQADSINTNAVSSSTQVPVTFDITTPELSQVRDPAPSESPSTNKNDAE